MPAWPQVQTSTDRSSSTLRPSNVEKDINGGDTTQQIHAVNMLRVSLYNRRIAGHLVTSRQ